MSGWREAVWGGAGGVAEAKGDGVFPGVTKPRLVWGAFYRQSYDVVVDDDDVDATGRARARSIAPRSTLRRRRRIDTR